MSVPRPAPLNRGLPWPGSAGRQRLGTSAWYDRLTRIRAEWDPDNVFHRNATIKPAVAVR